MNIFGLFIVEIFGAALFSLAFFAGKQKLKSIIYSMIDR